MLLVEVRYLSKESMKDVCRSLDSLKRLAVAVEKIGDGIIEGKKQTAKNFVCITYIFREVVLNSCRGLIFVTKLVNN